MWPNSSFIFDYQTGAPLGGDGLQSCWLKIKELKFLSLSDKSAQIVSSGICEIDTKNFQWNL